MCMTDSDILKRSKYEIQQDIKQVIKDLQAVKLCKESSHTLLSMEYKKNNTKALTKAVKRLVSIHERVQRIRLKEK